MTTILRDGLGANHGGEVQTGEEERYISRLRNRLRLSASTLETETERKRDELRAQERAGRWDTSNVRGTGRGAVSGVGWDGNGVRRGRRRKGGTHK